MLSTEMKEDHIIGILISLRIDMNMLYNILIVLSNQVKHSSLIEIKILIGILKGFKLLHILILPLNFSCLTYHTKANYLLLVMAKRQVKFQLNYIKLIKLENRIYPQTKKVKMAHLNSLILTIKLKKRYILSYNCQSSKQCKAT